MTAPLRRHTDRPLAAQRYAASQAAIEGAALAGELGVETQLVAMSALYAELKAAGRLVEAMELKAAAIKIRNGGK